jgi:hypothetical protein
VDGGQGAELSGIGHEFDRTQATRHLSRSARDATL